MHEDPLWYRVRERTGKWLQTLLKRFIVVIFVVPNFASSLFQGLSQSLHSGVENLTENTANSK